MNGTTTMHMLRKIVTEAKPTGHPRADDLLEITGDLVRTLDTIRRDLDVLDRADRRGRDMGTEPARDALCRLLAQRGWIEAIVGQYQAILADLDGEGYALLATDGIGVPYFGDDEGGGDNDKDEVNEQ